MYDFRAVVVTTELVHLGVMIQYQTIAMIYAASHHLFLDLARRDAHSLVYSRTQLFVPFAFDIAITKRFILQNIDFFLCPKK